MAVHKLILDDVFDEALYTLIAIHCTVEDYRLAYLLNNHLGVRLKKKPADLDFNNGKSTFSIYDWEDNKQQTIWSLVVNVCKKETDQPTNNSSLFSAESKIVQKSYLVPEYKQVNYFLKIDNEVSAKKERHIINNILNISQVSTAYLIDANQLKSKNNLIFS
ncbi:IPExxxVDY family protein [Flavobacteriaceae bacterium XHP0103]|uniref:IPExxxVDY family protein n=1 Tax=Marixanthotalea marina TaxID=2844359 RepID=UPI002989BF84|nr:IPExxxVDY family protein [Marixanthotalea marina]MBU3820542.1 IPExxxVDY family protein [Marixanthotalea marina]